MFTRTRLIVNFDNALPVLLDLFSEISLYVTPYWRVDT